MNIQTVSDSSIIGAKVVGNEICITIEGPSSQVHATYDTQSIREFAAELVRLADLAETRS